MPWNSRSSRTTWADDNEGINQIGCIHTCQGLEFDYVGVIIGKDLRYDKISKELYADWDSYKDSVGKKGLKSHPLLLTNLVKNFYKTLMTRGLKGCYIFIYDNALKEYFLEKLYEIYKLYLFLNYHLVNTPQYLYKVIHLFFLKTNRTVNDIIKLGQKITKR